MGEPLVDRTEELYQSNITRRRDYKKLGIKDPERLKLPNEIRIVLGKHEGRFELLNLVAVYETLGWTGN